MLSIYFYFLSISPINPNHFINLLREIPGKEMTSCYDVMDFLFIAFIPSAVNKIILMVS